jgi:hypothetical protein
MKADSPLSMLRLAGLAACISFRFCINNCRQEHFCFFSRRRSDFTRHALQRITRAPRSLSASRFDPALPVRPLLDAASFVLKQQQARRYTSPEVPCPYGTRWPRRAIRPCHQPDTSASAFDYALADFA